VTLCYLHIVRKTVSILAISCLHPAVTAGISGLTTTARTQVEQSKCFALLASSAFEWPQEAIKTHCSYGWQPHLDALELDLDILRV
jgi:hypothetical protein